MPGKKTRYEDIVVDGSEDPRDVRKLLAGLRLLRHYGRVAEMALKVIAGDGPIDMVAPSLTRRSYSSKGHYSLASSPIHRVSDLPDIPNLSDLSVDLKPLKSVGVKNAGNGFTIYLRGTGLSVRPGGWTVPVVLDVDIGFIWETKSRFNWSFRGIPNTKTGKTAVEHAFAYAAATAIVRFSSDAQIYGEVSHSKAAYAVDKLKKRTEEELISGRHAERLRTWTLALMGVLTVHAR